MTKQSLQLSALTLAGSLTTSLRRQYSSALEPRTLFLLVADIYRRISFVPTKVSSFLRLINCSAKLVATELRTDSKPAANMGLKEMAGEVVNQTFVLLMNSSGRLTVRASKPPLL